VGTKNNNCGNLLYDTLCCGCPVSVDLQAAGEPVWRQVLQLHLNHRDPAVAQQAAAALAEQ
jgi:hypothetical protein